MRAGTLAVYEVAAACLILKDESWQDEGDSDGGTGADSTPFSPLLMAPPPPSTLGCLGSRSELLMGTVLYIGERSCRIHIM